MKNQTLLGAMLVILLVSGLSWSQEPIPPEPMQTAPPSQAPPTTDPYTTRGSTRTPPSNETVTKIFELKHFLAGDLENLIVNIFGMRSGQIQSPRTDLLIIQATKEQMQDIEALIRELDVERPDSEGNREIENFIYRVYMFETPSRDRNMKPFSMILQTPTQVSTSILGVAASLKIQVSDFLISDEDDGQIDILIQGKAPSNESVIEMVDLLDDDSRIKELKWDDDETFTNSIAAANYIRLPARIQKHIQRFLGEQIVTTGYWFGSSSVPGEIDALIGPWKLHLELDEESDRTLELRIDVEVPEERHNFDRQLGRESADTILSNTIQAKIGKPIIIGYNRQSYGTRRMGAMVIIPEVDTIDSEEN